MSTNDEMIEKQRILLENNRGLRLRELTEQVGSLLLCSVYFMCFQLVIKFKLLK